MKTSDVELSQRDRTASGGVAGIFDWLLPKAKQQKQKFKAGTHPSAGGKADSKTRISQSIADVLRLLVADGVRKVAVHGDETFFQAFRAESGDIATQWISTDIFQDQPKGAKPVTAASVADCDAVVVGGNDVATKFRYSLRMMHAHAPTKPVHWVGQNWEFCAGTAAVPLEIEDVDALAFNHFEEFFGIKDPLQFRFEIIAEGETRRSYLVLGPSQSVNLNLKSLMPERKGAVCMKVFVAHPHLTRGRHYRFRVCGDVFWKDSFTIIHGSHQFFKNPDKIQPFRLIDSVVRNGEVVMTVPNYDLDMGGNDEVVIGTGAGKTHLKRSRTRPVEEVHFKRAGAPSTERTYFAASYAGYGTSFWYALDEGFSQVPGKMGSIAANHLCRVGVDNRDDILFTAEERAIVEKAIDAGFMIHPCCVPVTSPDSALSFGFNFDASNPPFDDYLLRFYDRAGGCVGEFRYRKDFIGPAYIDDVLAGWSHPRKAEVTMALVCPDHLKIGLAPQRLVTTSDMAVRHRVTGDQDFTEFQSSWRNVGADIPTLPHWLHPSIGIMGRTNVIGRVRTKGGFRTGVFVANASGNLKYDMVARVEIAAINHDGVRLSHFLTLPAFGAEIVWLDDVVPDLARHVGPSGIAALQVKSADADLTAHVLGQSPNGAVGLQHLWGY
ncbi:MAG: hypothetical protein JNL25_17985 [Rhodospirillaceae bacterium]|nr:hypothetical protein [Rhodospirillaceae bacterium]